jgi:LytS/YehU family sensor histidine kinase
MILIPKFLSKGKYLLFGFLLLLTILLTAKFNIVFFEKWVGYVLPGYYFISYYEYFDIVKFVLAFIVTTSLIKLSKGWFELSETNSRLSQLQKEKIETELKALKGQINPHFLFNSMNSIYSLALNQSEKTPEIILSLADIMRYIIYEASADFLDLTQEIRYLKDYIDLQKLRSDDRASISFEIIGKLENIRIAPLLFFPLVENSFKHGIKGATGDSFIRIQLQTNEKNLAFMIENNKGFGDHVKDGYKGMGLDNLKKRLEMTYPERHVFKINETDETFKVEMIIKHTSYET